LVSGGRRAITFWRLPEGELTKRIEGLRGSVIPRTVISPDGKFLIFGGSGDITIWPLQEEGDSGRCLLDLKCNKSDVKGVTYTVHDESGQMISYTLPCGSPLPAGATCTCNCVPGTYVAPPPPPQSGDSYGGGGSFCQCDQICTCVPICQAHKLLDGDPVIRAMAEQILLFIGKAEREYMDWAAARSPLPLRHCIQGLVHDIEQGRLPAPGGWWPADECERYLDHADPVVRVIAAQTLRFGHPSERGRGAVPMKVDAALRASVRMHWRRRA
jgi:hypothetical protein